MQKWTAAGLGAIATVALVGGAGVFAATADRPDGPRHGMHRMAPMYGAVCGPNAAERLDKALNGFQSFAKFEGEQQAAWQSLRQTIEGVEPDVKAICSEMQGARGASSVEKMAKLESSLNKAASIVGRVEPAYAKFYDTLDASQKKALDNVF